MRLRFSSLNTCLFFYYYFHFESIKLGSSRSQMSFEIDVFKNFAIFRRKYLCSSLLVTKLPACKSVHLRPVSSKLIFQLLLIFTHVRIFLLICIWISITTFLNCFPYWYHHHETVIDFPPSLFDLFISFFNLIGRKSKIYKRTHEADKKKVPGVQLFCGQLFPHSLTFFDNPTGYAHA